LRGDVSVCDVDGFLRFVEVQDVDADVAVVRVLERFEWLDVATVGTAARGCSRGVWYEGTIEQIDADGNFMVSLDGEPTILKPADVRFLRTSPFTLPDVNFARNMSFVVGLRDIVIPVAGLRRLRLVRRHVLTPKPSSSRSMQSTLLWLLTRTSPDAPLLLLSPPRRFRHCSISFF